MANFTTANSNPISIRRPSPLLIGAIVVGSLVIAALGVLTAGSGVVLVGVLVASAAAVIGVVALRQPALALPAAIWSMWFEGVGGDTLSLGRIMAGGLIGLVGYRVLLGGEQLRVPPALSWVPQAAFLMWAWASGLWSTQFNGWLFTTMTLFVGIGYYLVMFLEVRSPEQLWGIIKVWIWIGAGISLLVGVLLGFFDNGERAPGLSGGANNFATYLVSALPFLALYLAESKGPWKVVVAGLFPLYGYALVNSGSRAGFINATVSSLYVILTFPSASKGVARIRRITLGLGILGAGAFTAIFLNPERFLILASASADRGAGRLDIWNAGLHTLRSHWIVGMGMGQFREQSQDILQQVTGSSLRIGEYVSKEGSEILDTHNQYLQIWLDLGIIGLALYFTMIGTVAYTLLTKATEEWKRLTWAFLGVLITVHIGFMFMTQINQKFLWTVMGLSAAIASAAQRSVPREASRAEASTEARMVSDA